MVSPSDDNTEEIVSRQKGATETDKRVKRVLQNCAPCLFSSPKLVEYLTVRCHASPFSPTQNTLNTILVFFFFYLIPSFPYNSLAHSFAKSIPACENGKYVGEKKLKKKPYNGAAKEE